MFFAAIDIGTNSVLLLIGEPKQGGGVCVIEDRAEVTRLGEGLAKTGIIADKAAERTIGVLGSYWEACVRHGVRRIAVIGTAALRTAKNAGDFLLVVKHTLHLDIEVISEEREARLTYEAGRRDFGDNIAIIDIGGGSTELICKGHFTSLPIGCVSLTEKYCTSDPVGDTEIMGLRSEIRAKLKKHIDPKKFGGREKTKFVATAGTATTLMSMDLALEPYAGDLVHGKVLTQKDLRRMVDILKASKIEELKKIRGLIPERAEVILAGSILLDEAMRHLGREEVIISDHGVKWGLFYEQFC